MSSHPPAPPPYPTGLVTPEAVPLDLETAGIGSRFVALMLDWLVQTVLVGVIGSAAFALGALPQALGYLLVFLVIWGYPVGMETLWRGRTPGKAALGLRVVTDQGAPVRFRHAAIRASMGLVDFGVTLGAGAVLSALLSARNQRLGDLVAGTIVLRERRAMPAPAPVAFAVPPGLEEYAPRLDVSRVSADDYAAIRAFLVRAPSLRPAARTELASRLARAVAPRIQPPPPPGVWAETFLACVAAVYQRRSEPVGASPVGARPGVAAPAQPPPPPSPPPPSPPPPSGTGGGGFAPLP